MEIVNVITVVLSGFVGFAKKLGEPMEIWELSVAPIWVIIAALLFICAMVSQLKPRTKHGETLVIAWASALSSPFVIAVLLGLLLMLPGFQVVQPK